MPLCQAVSFQAAVCPSERTFRGPSRVSHEALDSSAHLFQLGVLQAILLLGLLPQGLLRRKEITQRQLPWQASFQAKPTGQTRPYLRAQLHVSALDLRPLTLLHETPSHHCRKGEAVSGGDQGTCENRKTSPAYKRQPSRSRDTSVNAILCWRD